MRFVTLSVAAACAALTFSAGPARAQSWQTNAFSVALKSGESNELMDLYFVANCKSLLVAPPEVTILDGPQGITASAPEAMVVPRFQQCAKRVKGAKLVLTAGQIEDQSNTLITLRIRLKTVDGVRERSLSGVIQLFP
jgi:hypothetical protein